MDLGFVSLNRDLQPMTKRLPDACASTIEKHGKIPPESVFDPTTAEENEEHNAEQDNYQYEQDDGPEDEGYDEEYAPDFP